MTTSTPGFREGVEAAPPLDINKPYRTRDGREARVVAAPDYTLFGWVATDAGYRSHSWWPNGQVTLNGDDPFDLVNDALPAPPAQPAGDVERVAAETVEYLRKSAKTSSEVSWMLANAKTERNHAAEGIPPGQLGYTGLTPEQTFEWKTADFIEQLIADRQALRTANETAEGQISSSCCVEDGDEPCGPFVSEQRRADAAEAEIARLRTALGYAREKLVKYRTAHGGEYVGGIEYTALLKLIDAALATPATGDGKK